MKILFLLFFSVQHKEENGLAKTNKISDVGKWKLGSQNRGGIKEELASGLTHSSSYILTFSGCKEFQGAK